MTTPLSPLQHLKESPQWILLPTKERNFLFVASLVATLIICIVSFFLTSALL